MAEIQELILLKVGILTDEISGTETQVEGRVAIHPTDIEYIEEYVGEIIENPHGDITNVFLYSGVAMVVKKAFTTLLQEINQKKKHNSKEGFFKGN